MKKYAKFLILLVLFLAAGCSKEDTTKPDDPPPPSPPPPPIDSVYQLTIRGFITYVNDTNLILGNPRMSIYLNGSTVREAQGLNPIIKIIGKEAKDLQGKTCYVGAEGTLLHKATLATEATTRDPVDPYMIVIPAKDIQTFDFSFYFYPYDPKK